MTANVRRVLRSFWLASICVACASGPGFTDLQLPSDALVHYTEDRLITVDQSQAMAEALAAAGKPHHLLLLDDSPGGETREALRLRYYRNLEAFFFQHLGGAAAAAPVAAAP